MQLGTNRVQGLNLDLFGAVVTQSSPYHPAQLYPANRAINGIFTDFTMAGHEEFKRCPPGSFSNETGQTTYLLCEIGTY